jgi:putative hydrolase of the HAD superfamily
MQPTPTLLWDFDGTLAQRQGGWSAALLAVLAHNLPGTSVTAEAIRPFLLSGFPWHAPENVHPGLSAEEWWEELTPLFVRAFRGVGVDGSQARGLARKVRPAYLDLAAWSLFPDALPALSALSSAGWRHVLFTNHVPELDQLLAGLGLQGRFAACFNSAITGVEKPNQKAFRAVLEWIGPGAKTWMIGDNYTADILGAGEAGIPAVLVRKPHPGVQYYCTTLAQLEAILA